MKRELSRFSTDELNEVINNWELIAKEYNGCLKIKKTTVDKRPLIIHAINKVNKDHLAFDIFKLDVVIPYKGGQILIRTNEVRPTLFEYLIKNNTYSFSIRNEELFDKITKLFGIYELQVEDVAFDKKYFLETNDVKYLQTFLDSKIRNWLTENLVAYFDLNSEKAKNKLSLYFYFNELNIESIKHQIEMFKYCIEKVN
ncbi:MAG: hypothetical protein GX587_13175, partial [Bacteroidales bacterium]|nr:hypothetical protein [Bacteroidales bacterium]